MSITSLMPSRLTDPERGAPVRGTLWERLDRPDSAALHGLMSGAVWLLVGTLLGLIMSDELTTPDIFAGIPQLTFSRLRPVHINSKNATHCGKDDSDATVRPLPPPAAKHIPRRCLFVAWPGFAPTGTSVERLPTC